MPPKPCVEEVTRYLDTWNKLENYVFQESSLDKLFRCFPLNVDMNDILLKCSCLNDFYSTNIFSVFSVAKNIFELNIDDRLKMGDVSLVSDIAAVNISGKEKTFYSFATKYCSHHYPEMFPIYDSYVDKVLWYFQQEYNFGEFKRKDLKHYPPFKDILSKFSQFYGLERFNLKEIDRYLWLLGKEFFLRSYQSKK